MDASIDNDTTPRLACPGRFTRVSVQTQAGEIEARLSEKGNWELLVRRDQDMTWRLACSGDLDCGAVSTQPVVPIVEETIRLGHLTIEPAARRASVGGTQVSLRKKEFALLLALASQPDRVFSKSELLASIWGLHGTVCTRTLDSHASRVRNKLRSAGAESMVVNCWGVGYRLWDRTDLTTFPPLTPVGEAA